jgi:glucose/arabinose dehydrogenase
MGHRESMRRLPSMRALGITAAACAVIAVAVSIALVSWRARSPRAGEVLFGERCAVCHGTDARGGQGPSLVGVVGRPAAAERGFAYSHALRESHLTWDAKTLQRYLAGPVAMVPGTTMPIAVTDAAQRRAIVAYLTTLEGAPDTAQEPRNGAAAAAGPFGDYRSDAPGRRHRIQVADLPAPFASRSVRNSPSVVDPPAGAKPAVPPRFRVNLFAEGLDAPRLARVAPNGDVFVAESYAGRIRVLHTPEGAAAPDRVEVFAEGLDRPFGIAFFPGGDDPQWVYVANVNSVVRFPYRNGDLRARGPSEAIVPRLTEQQGGHWTRDIAFSPDGKRMFLSVGSGSNVAENEPHKSAHDAAAWDATHGAGAAWGDETNRADVLVFDPDGKNGQIWATGIRNCVGLALAGPAGDLFCSTNERDGLGDNLVPDYVTRVPVHGFFGWPWYYLGSHEDPRHAGERPDLAGKAMMPDVLLQPHSAPLQMTFYDGSMFPAEYRGDAFVACHGSWNRAVRTGPKVVHVFFHDGAPTGEYEDFMTGFVVDEERVWGRPVGVAVARDGALLVTEDGNSKIWRVAYGARGG